MRKRRFEYGCRESAGYICFFYTENMEDQDPVNPRRPDDKDDATQAFSMDANDTPSPTGDSSQASPLDLPPPARRTPPPAAVAPAPVRLVRERETIPDPGFPGDVPEEEVKSQRLQWAMGALLLALLVGALGFYLGSNTSKSAQKEGYDLGLRRGKESARDEFKPGSRGYNDIYQAGVKEGEQKGSKQGQLAGRQAGLRTGREQGREAVNQELEESTAIPFDPALESDPPQGDQQTVSSAANAALGGFFDWQASSLYVVRVEEGQGDLPFQVTERTTIDNGSFYRLCANDQAALCRVPFPASRTRTGAAPDPNE